MMTHIICILTLIIISIVHVSSKSCNIIENMSCKCHSSLNGEIEQLTCKNNDMSSMLATIKLTNQTMNTNRSFDSFHLIFTNKKFNVSTMFLKELSYLFPQSTSSALGVPKSRIKITLSFSDFQQLHFENNSFYQLFHKHADHETILILELTSNGRITFSPMAFEQLTVDHMFLHTSSLEPYSFEEIFNGTHIGELTIEGKIVFFSYQAESRKIFFVIV